MLKKFVSSIRKKMQYNKFVVAVYNFFAVEILFRINGVKRKMKKQDCVFSDETLKSKFYLPYYKTDLIQRSILTNRNYFEYDLLWNLAFNWNEGILAKKIKDKAMLDIGANIGNHTLFFMNECGASFAHCFEPIKGTFEILKRNIFENGLYDKVRLYNVAIGKKEGNAEIASFHEDNLGGTCLKDQDNGQIKVVPIDSLEIENDVAFVKIDVEGFELNAVLGMQNFLKKLHPVVFIEIRGCFYNQINDIFTALGYKGELVEDMYGLDCANYIYY